MTRLLIGIGGASCSGKSTIANWLSHFTKCHIIHQDKFYKADSQIPLVELNGQKVQNWDCPEALDMAAFCRSLKEAKEKGIEKDILGDNLPSPALSDISNQELSTIKVLVDAIALAKADLIVVDGFLLYKETECIETLDIQVFMHTSHHVLKERRESRTGYVTIEDPVGYFDEVVIPEYEKNNSYATSRLNDALRPFLALDSHKLSVGEAIILVLEEITKKLGITVN